MNSALEDLPSIINGLSFAKDRERVFTYIEFVKMFGYENDPNVFINYYKDYVTKWAEIKNSEITVSDEDFIFSKMVEILKSITLDYSSYEEQDFIAHLNLSNKSHIKALSAMYSRKIRQITEFYRKKRNESVLIVNRNSIKGSSKSIQEIIYEKVFDYIFSDKNIVPSYKDIKRDLLVTVENYVDTYSEYFDIPRTKEFTDKSRREMLSANMNDVDYRTYLEIELVVSEILYSGNVLLEEIPLIAQLGIDLSQNCVGDMLALKNSLMANTTINQVDLNEQVALKRKLYEKYLGCDLWYLYVDLQGNVTIDKLCEADNPTGNLLNCGSPDSAVTPSNEYELLSHIGLFFKPDKTSILKINARDYTWSVDETKLIKDTVYIFPDPNSYGDIGNNKDGGYPLIMEYKLDWDVRNLSSGTSFNDPLLFVGGQTWQSYYSKQDDDFKNLKNIDWEYSFTYLANQGFLAKYQKDIWGNEFGILKGCERSTVTKIDENGNEVTVPKITIKGKGYKDEMVYGVNEDSLNTKPRLLNGGYFENPLYPGKLTVVDGVSKWVYQNSEDKVQPFNFKQRKVLSDDYRWSGIQTLGIDKNKEPIEFSPSLYDVNYINFGEFGSHEGIEYVDHFMMVPDNYKDVVEDDKVITEVLQHFFSVNLLENPEQSDIEFETSEDVTYEEIEEMEGDLFIKIVGDMYAKPIPLKEAFPWLGDIKIKNFAVYRDVLILETREKFIFVPYTYDGSEIKNNLGLRGLLTFPKTKRTRQTSSLETLPTKMLFVEKESVFYILQMEEWKQLEASSDEKRTLILPSIYCFNPTDYTLKSTICLFDESYRSVFEENYLNWQKTFDGYMDKKIQLIGDGELLKNDIENGLHQNVLDFEVPVCDKNSYGNLMFSYNSAIGTYLISYVIMDENGTPYIYEHKFKITSQEDFEDSLKTNVYTIKELKVDEENKLLDVYWVKNETLDGGKMVSYPDEALEDKHIFTSDGAELYRTYNKVIDVKDYNITLSGEKLKGTIEIVGYGKNSGKAHLQVRFDLYINDVDDVIYQNVHVVESDVDENGVMAPFEIGINSGSTPVDEWSLTLDGSFVVSAELNEVAVEKKDLTLKSDIWLSFSDDGVLTDCDLSLLRDGSYLFWNNKRITNFSYPVPNLIASAHMFELCSNLTTFESELEVVENADGMFWGCENLTNYDIDLMNTTSAKAMFKGCKSLNGYSNKMPRLVSGDEMFMESGLTHASVYTPFQKSAVGMFKNCTELENVNYQSYSLLDGREMFSGCTSLTEIDGRFKSLLNGQDMFKGCKLSLSSVQTLAEHINTLTTANAAVITLGLDQNIEGNKELEEALNRLRSKGWTVEIEFS